MDIDILLIALAVSLGINLSMFLIAFWRHSDKLTDVSYAASFAAIGIWMFALSDKSWYHILVLVLILLWALRLGGFLLYRVIRTGKDSRFDGMRENFFKFGKFWLTQAITAWAMMLPSIFAFHTHGAFQMITFIGIGLWIIGLISESTADIQKLLFSNNPDNKNKWIDSGIWQYSRHPNYFGEILIWVGVYLYAAPTLPLVQALVTLISPLFIIILLLFISGIPILEKSADKRWGNIPAYQTYKRRTSILVPLPHRK